MTPPATCSPTPTPFSGYSFAYDARNRQTQAFVGAIGTRWLVNGLGQRIAQINVSVPEFFFVYDEAGHLVGKYDGNGKFLQETVWLGDLPVARASAGRAFLYRAGSSWRAASDHRRRRRGGVAVEP